MKIFQIKHSSQLTWGDIPYVEAPVFAHHHIMNMLIDPNQLWMRIQNIQEFIRKEVGRYKPLQNHDLVEDRINYLISSAQYFNVSLSGKPFRAAFEWQSDENHLHKGFWEDKYNFYWMSPRVIQHHLDRITREWHRKKNSSEENSLSSREGVVAYAADPFTAQGMNSGYALSSPEQLKYISPVSGKSAIKQVDYLEIVDSTIKEVSSNVKNPSIFEKTDKLNTSIRYVESDFTNKNIHTYDELIFKAASENGIPAPILKGLLMLESSLQAHGPDSPVGAAGIAQFMPNTAARYGLSPDDRYIPEKAIPAAAQYLKALHNTFSVYAASPEDGWRLTMVAYNQGPGSFNKQTSDGAGAAQRLYGAASRLNLGSDRKQWAGKIPYSALTPAPATRHHVEMTVGTTGSIGGYSAQFKNDF